MELRRGMDSSLHLDSNNPQNMLSAFQAHNQAYFDFMSVLFRKTTADVIEFSQTG